MKAKRTQTAFFLSSYEQSHFPQLAIRQPYASNPSPLQFSSPSKPRLDRLAQKCIVLSQYYDRNQQHRETICHSVTGHGSGTKSTHFIHPPNPRAVRTYLCDNLCIFICIYICCAPCRAVIHTGARKLTSSAEHNNLLLLKDFS